MKNTMILETKLRPPDCSRMLTRPRLLDMLVNSQERLVVVCADAGFGKTTLMAQCHDAGPGPAVWYQLGSSDRDMAVFLAHLIDGSRRQVPAISAALDELSLGKSPDGKDWEHILTTLISALSTHAAEPLVFIFDEFRLVSDCQPVVDAVQFLVSHLPSGFRVMIASREKPPLALGRLRTQRLLLEVDTDELRFTVEETGRMLAECSAGPLSAQEVEAWHEATEGWPVALVLSRDVLDADHRLPEDVNPELLGARGAIAGYLAEEIWSGLDSSMKRFLMDTSLLDTVEVDICDRALLTRNQGVPSVQFLQDLERRNLMVVRLESNRSYRFNPLVRQFLRGKLEQESSLLDIDRLHRMFGEAFAESGNYVEAIAHLLESRSAAQAAEIIESRGEAIMESGRYDTLASWLAGIPQEDVRARPWLSYFSARVNERQGDLHAAAVWYKLAEEGFRRSGDERGLFACAHAMAEFFFMQNQHRKSLKKAGESLEWASTPNEKVSALSRMAIQNLLLGFGQDALKLLNEATAQCDESMVDTRFTLAADALASSWFAGDYVEAHEEVLRLQRESGPRSPMFARYQVLCWKVLTLHEMARYDEALAAIEERQSFLGEEDQVQELGFEFFRGVVMLCIGNGQAGFSLLEELEKKVGDKMMLGPFYSTNYIGAYLRRQNRLTEAITAHSQSLKGKIKDGNQYTAAICLVNLGADRLRRDIDDPKAVRDLQDALALGQKHGYEFVIAQARFHLAWRSLELGDENGALAGITRSLELAARHQYNNFIIQEGRISAGLLALAFEHDIERDYLLKVFPQVGTVAIPALAGLLNSESTQVKTAAIIALGAAGGAAAAPSIRKLLRDRDVVVRRTANAELALLRTSIEDHEKILSPRENQVLEMMAEGLGNAEIAERLFISEPTVKTHATKIFRKLGMTRRSQAAVYFQHRLADKGKPEG